MRPTMNAGKWTAVLVIWGVHPSKLNQLRSNLVGRQGKINTASLDQSFRYDG